MKRNRRTLWMVSFTAALLLLLPAAYAQERSAELDNGVTWDMTIEQMKELEGVTDDGDMDTYSFGVFTQYGFPRPEEEDRPVRYDYYIFRNDQLVMYGFSIHQYLQPDDIDMAIVYDGQYAILCEQYGEPADQDTGWFIRMFDLLEEGTVTEEIITAYSAWDLGGGTRLCLVGVEDGSVTSVYINEPGITAAAE